MLSEREVRLEPDRVGGILFDDRRQDVRPAVMLAGVEQFLTLAEQLKRGVVPAFTAGTAGCGLSRLPGGRGIAATAAGPLGLGWPCRQQGRDRDGHSEAAAP